MSHRACVAACAALLLAGIPAWPADPPTSKSGCFAAGNGYLRARLRGEINLDLDWKDADMSCEGGPRPSGNGLRVSIGGPLRGDGRRIRMVFGIAGLREGASGESLRTNVTILFEGEKRMFATQGDDKCTADSVTQQRVETLGPGRAVYRVIARGFCVGPATNLDRSERIVLQRFDFAGRVEFGDDDRGNSKLPNDKTTVKTQVPTRL
jgi:hypothetical protein